MADQLLQLLKQRVGQEPPRGSLGDSTSVFNPTPMGVDAYWGLREQPLDMISTAWQRRSPALDLIVRVDTVAAPMVRAISSTPTTEAQPSAIRANWQALSVAKLSDRLTLRIYYLAQTSIDRSSGLTPMRADSLASFLKFWELASGSARDPDIVLTPKGNIQAEWFKNRTHFLEIDFRNLGGDALFGLFAGKEKVFEGAASIEEILGVIKSYQNGVALTWAS